MATMLMTFSDLQGHSPASVFKNATFSYSFATVYKISSDVGGRAVLPARILTQNTSKDAVPRKDVPFGGRKTKS